MAGDGGPAAAHRTQSLLTLSPPLTPWCAVPDPGPHRRGDVSTWESFFLYARFCSSLLGHAARTDDPGTLR